MTPPTQPLEHGVPQTPKSKQVMGEKTLCNLKCLNGWCKRIKFFPGSAEARLASNEYTYVMNSHRTKRLIWRNVYVETSYDETSYGEMTYSHGSHFNLFSIITQTQNIQSNALTASIYSGEKALK